MLVTATLIIGAGGVGTAVTHKCAQNNTELGDIWLASRTSSKCDHAIAQVHEANNLGDRQGRLEAAQVDAMDTRQVSELIERIGAGIVINVATPYCNRSITEACLQTGASYIDTAVAETEGVMNVPPPWYAAYEWSNRERFTEAGVTGILGMGFDPGAVNAFCAYVAKHELDEIDTIDIMDVNGGDHGRYFATNFDPDVNLREIMEEVVYWNDGEWVTIPCHSRKRQYDFPVVGEQTVYSMGHDEIHSLAANIPARRIEFWMGFGERYLNCFNVLKELGLLSNQPVEVDGVKMAPIKMVKAVLPDPASLAPGYTGEVCIGCLVSGRSAGAPRSVFIYTTCDHARCYQEIRSQAISYTTAVPAVTAALLVARGPWDVGRLVNVEELDPDPFMALMPEVGLDWEVREESVELASRRQASTG
jgi:saccharopine dehydrogenase-like NADP-dependent oxidoreductase